MPTDLNDERYLVIDASLPLLVESYRYLIVKELRKICNYHCVRVGKPAKLENLRESLLAHQCRPACGGIFYIFRGRSRPRSNVEWKFTSAVTKPSGVNREYSRRTISSVRQEDHAEDLSEDGEDDVPEEDGEDSHLDIADDDLRLSIIEEWQSTFSTLRMRRRVCAVCAKMIPESMMVSLNPSTVPLQLLRNDDLPVCLLPTDYNIEAYEMAILHVGGLTRKSVQGPMRVCESCDNSLRGHTMPKFALANWLYYGHSVLPPKIRTAFNKSTSFERMLIARARASNICFRFGSYFGAEEDVDTPRNAALTSRKGVRGNVMVTPLDVTRLNSVLPPGPETIADTMCAVFVGRTSPSRSTIAKMSPVLVRKTRVKSMIEFLLEHNPHYRTVDGFKGFSADNLNRLFGEDDKGSDEAVPCSMEIGYLRTSDAVESATSDYTLRNEYEVSTSGILMENVGFTAGDDSPQSYRDMKMRALSHCLTGGTFMASRRGSRMVPDFDNPYLLSWLFPHLDPWGIGGFHHPKRKIPLTMDQQLSHLLQTEGGRFSTDPEFAFVFYNIKQKKLVSQNVRFRVPQSRYNQIVKDLLNVDIEQLLLLQMRFKKDPMYRPANNVESHLVRLLANVNMVGSNVPGSAAYKVSLRNEIRSVINYRGPPTLFITINPSDVDHPLVRLNSGQDIDLEDVLRGEDMDKWSRMILAAKNPSACALFFHSIISSFTAIVLNHKGERGGLFGKCTSYYGTVEANGRGTLHCHMLIWLRGHPSPQKLRDKMANSPEYRDKTFRWLESIIKCELLGSESVVVEKNGPIERPKRNVETGDPHPGTIPAPSVKDMVSIPQFMTDFEGFVNALVKEYNWHVHTSACWKHLGRRQAKNDANCRMGIDGHTTSTTSLDPETSSIVLRRLHPRIAAYNDVVLFLVQCNMDIKFIGSGEAAKAYLYYITDYITKPSLPVHVGLAALSYAIKQTHTRFPFMSEGDRIERTEKQKGAMIITVNSMIGHQEISHQQVMSYLVGGGDHYTPESFQILHWRAFLAMAKRIDESRVNEPSANLEVESEVLNEDANVSAAERPSDEPTVVLQLGARSITASSQVSDYIYRNSEFGGMSLYEFTEITRKVALPEASRELIHAGFRESLGTIRGGFSSPEHPQYNTHVMRVRPKRVIPVILGDKFQRPDRSAEELELWAKSVLLLFLPWRDFGTVKNGFQDWTAAYESHKYNIKPRYHRIIRNLNVLTECRDARGEQSRKWRNERLRDGVHFEVDEALEAMLGEENSQSRVANVFDAFGPDGGADDNDYQRSSIISSELGARNSYLLDQCLDIEDGRGNEGAVQVVGVVSEMCGDDESVVPEHASAMVSLKRKRRPDYQDITDESSLRRVRTRVTEPATSMEELVDVRSRVTLSNAERDSFAIGWKAVQGVIEEMNMAQNEEQMRAFRIMARRLIEGGPQLLMYVAGVGGTGKSHLIKALVKLFVRLGRRQELLIGAPTGIAAVLIGGFTMHSLSMTNPHRKGKDVQELIALWKGVRFLVIDEVSMVGALFLSQFSARLKQAKSEDGNSSSQPFGGVNVIFTGDFGQLKPPRQHSLFAHQLVDDPSFEESKNADGIDAMNGAFLWRQVNVVVKLVKNHRHDEDRDYANLLDRIRLGQCRPNSALFQDSLCTDDLEFLRRREISRIVDLDPESLLTFRDAPVIVGSRSVRDAVNAKYVAFHARRLTQPVHLYHAKDSVKRAPVSGNVKERLWGLSSRDTRDSLGRLPLFPGMKVMVTENLAFSKGIVNGVEGVVHDIKFTVDPDGNRYAAVVYLRVQGVEIDIPGLEEGIVPIFPETMSFDFRFKDGDKIRTRSVTRKQLPLLPAYSYTDFKSQGRTLDRAIVDLYTARGQGVYVMLSRVKTLKGIAIMRWFPSTKIFQRLSEDMRDEIIRIDFLDKATLQAYMAGHL